MYTSSVSTSSFSCHTFCAGSMPNFYAYSLLKTTTACFRLLHLHPNSTSWPTFIPLLQQQSSSQPPPQPGLGSAPRAARQHQMNPELTGTARRAHHDTSSRRQHRWTFTCHRHHTLSCILRGLSTQRWLCWRTDAGTNTQNLNCV